MPNYNIKYWPDLNLYLPHHSMKKHDVNLVFNLGSTSYIDPANRSSEMRRLGEVLCKM